MINITELFLRNPDRHVAYDHDFAFPSAGHMEKAADGDRLVPVAWSSAIEPAAG